MLRVSIRTTVWVAALCAGVAGVGLVAWWPKFSYMLSGCGNAGAGGCRSQSPGTGLLYLSAWLTVLVGLFVAGWVLIVSPGREDSLNLASARKFCVVPTVVAEVAFGQGFAGYALGDDADRFRVGGLLVIAMVVAALPIGIGARRPAAYVIVCAALAACSLAWSAFVVLPTPLMLVYSACLLVSAASAAQAAYPRGRPAR
jgi:hypothetical protein